MTIDVPDAAGEVLRDAFGNTFSLAALEAIASEGYRSGKLSRYEVQKILGFDNRWETDEWLGAHGLHGDYSVADLEADRRTLEDILGSVKQ